MLGYKHISQKIMTQEEWKELNDLRVAISEYPATVVPEKQERFTELLIKSWEYIDTVPGPDGLVSGTLPCQTSKSTV